MSLHRRLFLALAVLASAPLAVSATYAPAAPVQDVARLAPGGFRWLDDGPWDGPIYMIVSIDRQMIHVYDGDSLIGLARISTGKKGHSTPKGVYPILQKNKYHQSNIYSNAPMPFMQRLTWSGIALHAGHDPGYPASHGCIRLPYAFAQKLFGITRLGTLVDVTADRLSPLLKLDPLVLTDPGSTVMTFTTRPDTGPGRILAPPSAYEDGIPWLDIDSSIFTPVLTRSQSRP